jgi:release factor glutamine methyltransferase
MTDLVATLRAAGCVFAEEEAELLRGAATSVAELTSMTGRRVAGEPLEYVIGRAEFCGISVVLTPGVFIPRRRTEFLAREAIRRCAPGAVVVDLCCGSGAVGAAIAAAVMKREGGMKREREVGGELHAVDIDPVATSCAARNVPGTVYTGDLFDPLPDALRGRVDVLVVNPPYVPTAEIPLMPAEAREYEPLVTLDGGTDGLDVLRRAVRAAPRWLAPGGCLLAETSARQAARAVAAIADAGLAATVLSDAEFGATVLCATVLAG